MDHLVFHSISKNSALDGEVAVKHRGKVSFSWHCEVMFRSGRASFPHFPHILI